VATSNERYFYPETQLPESTHPVTSEKSWRTESELSTRRLILHGVLLALSAVTVTLTGAANMLYTNQPDSWIDILKSPVTTTSMLVRETSAGNYGPLLGGLLLAFSLLLILAAHEFGHYFACRHYGVRATLPFFLPAPPYPVTPFGTFGAVIKIKEPIRSRRALFDIGIAGPLAGFALAVPASFIGLLIAQPATPQTGTSQPGMVFNDPLLFKILISVFHVPNPMNWNPLYWAAWTALLVTSLNLFPLGQLDGGHVLYAVCGRRFHKIASLVVFTLVALLAVASFFLYNSPIWFLWTAILAFLLYVGHPPTYVDEPLGKVRIGLAVVAAIVFLLCFMPFPITLS
jgi:membrane-associated protease RseP (regulator of RpoE activity)